MTATETSRWRREIGHAILSEKEIEVDHVKCLEVETRYAVVLVCGDEVHASISKVRREAMYWGVFAHKKHRRLCGTAARWFMTQTHRVGRRTQVSPDSRTTRMVCGAEIYYQATTGDNYYQKSRREIAERKAREEEGRKKLQPRIDAGEFDPKNFEDYWAAMRAFQQAKYEVGLELNGPSLMDLYPKQKEAV